MTKTTKVHDSNGCVFYDLNVPCEKDVCNVCESKTTTRRIFTVHDSNCYWSMPDGSNRCITKEDAKLINEALRRPINPNFPFGGGETL